MFVDSVEIFITSGSGGAGCVSFRREKFVIQGGPDGGDGGRGGDVIFEVDNNAHTLANFRGKKHHKAGNGEAGKPKRCAGKSGANCIIKVPLGTQILDIESGEVLHDFDEGCDLSFVALNGGKGGLGNAHFKTATNQAPTYAQKGIAGQSLRIKLELKLIADVGLVGYPNVGKSTLISTLSNAKPEVANYEFTTLSPHLGVVESTENGAKNALKGFGESFVMADIPGIIEGASEGKGLGLQFLQHIERTKFLLFVLDCTRLEFAGLGLADLEVARLESNKGLSLKEQFCTLKSELQSYSSTLATRPFGIALSKIDALHDEAQTTPQIAQLSDFANALESPPAFILPISAITRKNLDKLKLHLFQSLQKL